MTIIPHFPIFFKCYRAIFLFCPQTRSASETSVSPARKPALQAKRAFLPPANPLRKRNERFSRPQTRSASETSVSPARKPALQAKRAFLPPANPLCERNERFSRPQTRSASETSVSLARKPALRAKRAFFTVSSFCERNAARSLFS